jgi:hypothetical protein
MSAELVDFRGKITPETHAALEALSQVTGRDRNEIVRDWLHEKAAEHIHIASVLHSQLLAKGMAGVLEGARGTRRGASGNRRESGGSSGSSGT